MYNYHKMFLPSVYLAPLLSLTSLGYQSRSL